MIPKIVIDQAEGGGLLKKLVISTSGDHHNLVFEMHPHVLPQHAIDEGGGAISRNPEVEAIVIVTAGERGLGDGGEGLVHMVLLYNGFSLPFTTIQDKEAKLRHIYGGDVHAPSALGDPLRALFNIVVCDFQGVENPLL